MSKIFDLIVSVVSSAFGATYKRNSDNTKAAAKIDINNSQNIHNVVNIDQSTVNHNYHASSATGTDLWMVIVGVVFAIIAAIAIFIKYKAALYIISWVALLFELLIYVASIRADAASGKSIFPKMVICGVILVATGFDIVAIFDSIPKDHSVTFSTIANNLSSNLYAYSDVYTSLIALGVLLLSKMPTLNDVRTTHRQNKPINIRMNMLLLSISILVLSIAVASGGFSGLIHPSFPR